jgi:transketolase C-terminal domain/subunit
MSHCVLLSFDQKGEKLLMVIKTGSWALSRITEHINIHVNRKGSCQQSTGSTHQSTDNINLIRQRTSAVINQTAAQQTSDSDQTAAQPSRRMRMKTSTRARRQAHENEDKHKSMKTRTREGRQAQEHEDKHKRMKTSTRA